MKSKIEAAVTWMEERAADPRNGYSQANRWGPDYDCSSFVITAWQQAGVLVKDKGATYTGNMRTAFLACGFKNVTQSINLATGSGLHRGDVLLNDLDHTAVCVGMGRVVHARSSEGNTLTGDQSGNEIRTQAYFNYPWLCVLRYPETVALDDEAGETAEADAEPAADVLQVDGECGPETWEAIAKRMPIVRKGSAGWAVTALQAMLNFLGADLDADGDCGPLTENEIKEFQRGKL